MSRYYVPKSKKRKITKLIGIFKRIFSFPRRVTKGEEREFFGGDFFIRETGKKSD